MVYKLYSEESEGRGVLAQRLRKMTRGATSILRVIL